MKLTVMEYMVQSGYMGGTYDDDTLDLFVAVNYVSQDFIDYLREKKKQQDKQ